MERKNKTTRPEARTKRVNAYTATKTTLVGLQGIGVRTLDYIWNCRERGEKIDVEHVRSLKPKVLQILDFSVPGSCDPESTSSSSDSDSSSRKRSKKQSITTLVSGNDKLAEQVARLTAQMNEAERRHSEEITSLRQVMDAAKEQHRIQYDDCMAFLRANKRRVQILETCTAEIQTRLHDVEQSLIKQRENGIGVQDSMVENKICELHEQLKSQVTDDLDQFQSDIAYLAEKIDHLQSARGVAVEPQPCISTPNLCSIVNTEVDGQHQHSSNRLASANTVATSLEKAGPMQHSVNNMREHEYSHVLMAPGNGELQQVQHAYTESCQQQVGHQRFCDRDGEESPDEDDEQSISELMPSPKRYDGTTDFASYEVQFTIYANRVGWTPAERLQMFAMLVEDKALDYYVSNEPRHRGYGNIEEAFNKFRARFSRTELPQSLRGEFHQLRQKPEESIDDWADRVQSVASNAFVGMADDFLTEETVRRFSQGLYNTDAAMFVGSKLPASLPKAIQAAKEYTCNQTAIYGASRKCKAVSFESPEPRVRTVNSDDIQSVVKMEIAGFKQAVAELQELYKKAVTPDKETRFSTIAAEYDKNGHSPPHDTSSPKPDDYKEQSSRNTRSTLNSPRSK